MKTVQALSIWKEFILYFRGSLQLTRLLLLESSQVSFLRWDLALFCNNAQWVSHLPLSSLAQWHTTLSLIRQRNHKSSQSQVTTLPFYFLLKTEKRWNFPSFDFCLWVSKHLCAVFISNWVWPKLMLPSATIHNNF